MKKKEFISHIKEIQRASNEKKLAIFVGAGVSANSGYPSWCDLLKDFAKELEIQKDEFDSSDYLKIPQYYCNQKGEKPYYNKLKAIFTNETFKPNPIHDLLFDFQPYYFITTNYDNLIEQKITSTQATYKIIKDDKEFKDAGNHRLVIKMHGDKDKIENIVLKETDYSNYFEKYKLTETFIKSIFTTHVVLFVGYSINDANVNQIYNWVRNILPDKKAYLISLKNFENQKGNEKYHETMYFKKRGIIQLNYYDLEKSIEKYLNIYKPEVFNNNLEQLNNKQGKDLYKFLTYMRYYVDDEVSNLSPLDKLIPFNYVKERLINILLKEKFPDKKYNTPIKVILERGVINDRPDFIRFIDLIRYKFALLYPQYHSDNLAFLVNNSLITEKEIQNQLIELKQISFLKETNKKYLEKLVLELKSKEKQGNDEAFLQNLHRWIFSKEISLSRFNEILNKCKELIEFEYKRVYSTLMGNETLYKNSFDIFQKAFFLHTMDKKKEAENELEHVAKIAFDQNNLLLYSLAKISLNQFKNLPEQETYNEIKNKYIPITYEKILTSLISIDDERAEVYEIKRSLETLQDKKVSYMRGGELRTFRGHLNAIEDTLRDIWLNINQNYLFKNVKFAYEIGIEGLLSSYSFYLTSASKEDKECFVYFDLYLMINEVETDKLRKLFIKYDIKTLNLSDEKDYDNKRTTKEILIDTFRNIIDSSLELEIVTTTFAYWDRQLQKIYNFLLIFSSIELTKNDCEIITDKYIEFARHFTKLHERYLIFEFFIDFIFSQFNRNQNNIDVQLTNKIIVWILEKIQAIDFNLFSNLDVQYFLDGLWEILKNKTEDVDIQILELIKKIQIDNIDIHIVTSSLFLLLPKDYQINYKNRVKDFIVEDFDKNWKFYPKACLNDMMQPEVELEQKYKDKINDLYKDQAEDENKGIVHYPGINYEIKLAFHYLTELIRNNKLINHPEFKEFLDRGNNFFDFIYDMEKYFDKLSLDDLDLLTDTEMSNLITIIRNDGKRKDQLFQKIERAPDFQIKRSLKLLKKWL